MEKHTKKTPSLFRYPVLVAFGLFFIGLFVLDMATPDRAYSELENTTLTQRPRLTAVSADGLNNYFTSYTRYVKDQVFWPRPVDQPAERGGDHPLPKDPERWHPAGPGAHDVRPALQHPEK